MKIYYALIVLLILLAACDGNVTELKATGDLMGRVVIKNNLGLSAEDNSGIKVEIKAGDEKKSAVTDMSGTWEIADITQGIYDISYYLNDDYDITNVYAFQFVGNGTAWAGNDTIYQISDNEIESLAVNTGAEECTIFFTYKSVVDEPEFLYQRIFFYSGADISKSGRKFDFSIAWGVIADLTPPIDIDYTVDYNLLKQYYDSGETVYAVVYAGYSVENTDYRNNTTTFPGLSNKPSNVAQFVMP